MNVDKDLKHIFIQKEQLPLSGGYSLLDKELVRYLLKVLRFRPGQQVILIDPLHVVLAQFISSESKSMNFEIIQVLKPERMDFKLNLFLGLPKKNKMDTIVDMVTQAGVASIYPFFSEFSDVLECSKSKLERWDKLAVSAAQQSKRWDVPEIHPLLSFGDCLKSMPAAELLVFYEHEKKCSCFSARLKQATEINLFIGPEGGFSLDEIAKLTDLNATVSSLSRLRLRTETAALAACSLISAWKLSDG